MLSVAQSCLKQELLGSQRVKIITGSAESVCGVRYCDDALCPSAAGRRDGALVLGMDAEERCLSLSLSLLSPQSASTWPGPRA